MKIFMFGVRGKRRTALPARGLGAIYTVAGTKPISRLNFSRPRKTIHWGHDVRNDSPFGNLFVRLRTPCIIVTLVRRFFRRRFAGTFAADGISRNTDSPTPRTRVPAFSVLGSADACVRKFRRPTSTS